MNRATRRLLAEAGTCLFGPQYRSEMARQLKVHLRTVMRWDRGETAIPQSAWEQLAALLKARQVAIAKILPKLPVAP